MSEEEIVSAEEEVVAEETPTETIAEETSGPLSDNWRSSIEDEDLRLVADRFNSPADAVKAVKDLRQQISNSIKLPKEGASEEEVAKFRKALGVPESPGEYEFTVLDGQEPTEADKEFHGKLAEMFHASNVPKETAVKLNGMWNEMVAQQVEAQEEADTKFIEETKAVLEKKWGGDYARNANLAARAAEALFDQNFEDAKLIEMKDGRFLLDHPVIMEALAKAGAEMDEDGFHRIDDSERSDIQSQVDQIGREKMEAYDRGDSVKANELDKKQRELLDKLYRGSIVGSEGRVA